MWIKIALAEIGPFMLVAIRCLFASIAIFIINSINHRNLLDRKFWIFYIVQGIFNLAVPFLLISWSEHYISSGLASILHSTIPLITLIIAHFYLSDDRITHARLVGLLIGFSGVILLMADQFVSGIKGSVLGGAGMLLAAISIAGTLVYARKKAHVLSADSMAFGQAIVACVCVTPFIPIFEAPIKFPLLSLTWVSLFWMGLINTGIGPLLYYALIRDIGATRTSLLNYIFPLVGVFAGVIFLGERLSWYIFAGGALIILGVAIANTQRKLLEKWMSLIKKSENKISI